MLIAGAAGALAAMVTAAAATRWLAGYLRGRGVVDRPNERSSHSVPTPRGGGLGIILGALAGVWLQAWIWDAPAPALPVLAALGGIAAVGWLDDVFGLRADARMGLQCGCAAIVVASGGLLPEFPLPAPLDFALGPVAGWAVSMAWVVGVTNIYNFLDGIDGFAAFQAIAACLAMVLFPVSSALNPVLLAVAGACAGFLVHNWHPAKIFMGDAGSTTLGFLLAVVPLQAPADARPMAVLFTATALWFFLADGVYTLARRAIRGERVWEAHRTHLYQRLAAAGMRHDQVVIRVGFAGILLAGLSGGMLRWGGPGAGWLVLAAAVAGFLAYRHEVERLDRKRRLAESWSASCRSI